MEVDFGQAAYSTHFDGFMRHYLTVKTGEIPINCATCFRCTSSVGETSLFQFNTLVEPRAFFFELGPVSRPSGNYNYDNTSPQVLIRK